MKTYSFFKPSIITTVSIFYLLIGTNALFSANSGAIQNPQKFIGSIFDSIVEIASNELNNTQKIGKMVDLFDKNVDYVFVARAILGSVWKKASDNEKRLFSLAFKDYLAKKYSTQFFEFNSEKIKFKGVKELGLNSFIVESKVISDNSKSFDVAWQVVKKKAEFKLINIKFEGVSMIHSERAELKSLIRQHSGSIPSLIKAIKDY